jgi:hypothetical protein
LFASDLVLVTWQVQQRAASWTKQERTYAVCLTFEVDLKRSARFAEINLVEVAAHTEGAMVSAESARSGYVGAMQAGVVVVEHTLPTNLGNPNGLKRPIATW